jgi:hypothetical protein
MQAVGIGKYVDFLPSQREIVTDRVIGGHEEKYPEGDCLAGKD